MKTEVCRRQLNYIFVLLCIICAFFLWSDPPKNVFSLQSRSRPVVILLCADVNIEVVNLLNSFIRQGLDAHVIPDTEIVSSVHVHYLPTHYVQTSGYSLLNPNMESNVSAWDRGILWTTSYLAETGNTFAWFIELDVWLADKQALSDLIRHFEASPCDLIAADVLSRGPGVDDWYWWYDHRVSEARGASGDLMLPRKSPFHTNGAPLIATFNVLSRLSSRLLHEIARVAAREGRLIIHEALFPSLVRAREREGWSLTWFALPWVNIRWRPEFTEEEAREGVREQGWRIIHPVKEAWHIDSPP